MDLLFYFINMHLFATAFKISALHAATHTIRQRQPENSVDQNKIL